MNSVEKGGPADKAGIEAGDIIVKVDGRDVATSAELPRIITQVETGHARSRCRSGARARPRMWRSPWPKSRRTRRRAPARRDAPGKEKAKPNRMGLVLSDLTDDQKKELEIKIGVIVEDMRGTARGNMQPGDVILAVISRGATIEAKSAEQVNALIAKLDKGASVTLQLRRGEQQFFSTIKLGNGGAE